MTNTKTDAQLLAMDNAFELIFQRYEKLIYHVCRRYFNNTEDAMDAGQEAALRLYRAMHTVIPKPDGSIKSWVCTVTANVCLDILRKKRVETVELTAETKTAAIPAAEEDALARERIRELTAAIARLPDEQRIILILRDLQQLSYEELAEVLGISMGTVKSRIARARAAVRKML
jgi:RNA polymerase sigma-70 factor (ECF subfamily)